MNVSQVNNLNMVNNTMAQASMNKSENFKGTLENVMHSGDSKQMRDAAIELESYFINRMFTAMRNTVDREQGLFPPSKAEEIFQAMLDTEVASNIANSGGVGIADMMYEQMARDL
jgi:peptidoglycan hydrolase FlgJ